MDALRVLHTAQHHHHVFPELQSYWHELTLGVQPWDYFKTITLVLHPCQILFVPEAFSKLHNVTKLEIISECMPVITCCSLPVSCLDQLHPMKYCLSIKACALIIAALCAVWLADTP